MTDERKTGDPGRKVGRGRKDGTGAFAGTQHGGGNDGVSSARPQVITGHEDATFRTDAGKREHDGG